MRKIIVVITGVLMVFTLAACGKNEEKQPLPEESIVVRDGERQGNTEFVTKRIQETVGGDLFRIETVQDYPLDHDPLVDQAADEQDESLRPELAGHIESMEQYDTVILGYPNWRGDLPMPVYSFLEEYDFGAKTIIPFVTHGGSGFSDTRNTIFKLQSGAFVSDNTLSLSRNDVAESEDEIRQWAESLNLNVESDMPDSQSDTVANATADPRNRQTLYLWEKGNAPATTEYTQNNGNYADDPDFRPYIVTFPVPEGTEVKGAVLICAGSVLLLKTWRNLPRPICRLLTFAMALVILLCGNLKRVSRHCRRQTFPWKSMY